MQNNLPDMTYAEKIEIRDIKHGRIINFLADFEVFTTIAVVALMIEISKSNSRRALEQLVKSGLLITEDHFIDGHRVKIYGITHHGLVASGAEADTPYFERGKVKSHYIQHKLETQRVRIIAEKIGADFKPERKIRLQSRGLKKIPDGMASIYLHDPNILGSKLFIECERECKSFKRLSVVHKNYLDAMENDLVADSVLYLYPQKILNGAIKLHRSLPDSECPDRDNLADKRPYRFMFGTLENFPNDIQFADGTAVQFTRPVPDGFD